MDNKLDKKTLAKLLGFQQDEIDGSEIYRRMALMSKSEENRKIFFEMAQEEYAHYRFISNLTGKTCNYNYRKVAIIVLLTHLLGMTFTLKMLEKDEKMAVANYRETPLLSAFAAKEDEHENTLLSMVEESRLNYMGSIVLGLNDALVEFTGALAGYTLALGSTNLIALTGSITGIAAALSMGSSEYLSTKSEGGEGKHPFRAAFYTSLAYIITVFLLIAPFIWLDSPVIALVIMLLLAIGIIAIFNFYYAVVRGEKFRRRFGEMALISFSVAALSFVIGYLLKVFTGIEG